MKKLILVLSCLYIFGACKSKSTTVEKTPVAALENLELGEVNPMLKDKAYDLGKRVLNTCNTSKFKPFTTSEATDKVIQNTTLERLSNTCQKYLIKYGKFQDIELVEVIKNNNDNSMLFRYKANYQRKFTQKELQVTLNEENKVSSIKSTDWKDIYVP